MQKAISAWVRLVRLDHGIMSSVGVLIGMLIMQKTTGLTLGSQEFAFALLVPIYIQVAAFALNDLLDVETDRYNKRADRPLVNGEISVDVARNTALFGFILGIVFAFLINTPAGIIAAVFAALSIAYDYKLKDMPVAGNAYIAISMAIAFIFGAVAVFPDITLLPPSIWLVACIAYFAGLGREIVKTVQDMEGDKIARKAKTMPIIIGKRKSLLIAALAYVLFAVCAAWLLYSYALPFMVLSGGLVAIAILAFLFMAHEMIFTPQLAQERLAAMRKASLCALMTGLTGILIAAI